MEKVIVIGGPTASGKTGLGVELAKQIQGEIVSADSMQIYKKMNIGTAKPTVEEMQGIPHHGIDFVEPDTRYSVADFKKDATKDIKDILERGKVPIVVGGTGLYINSLIDGIDYKEIPFDENYRAYLETCVEQQGLDALYQEAKQIDPEAMKHISKNDKKRILRVLEIYKQTGKTKTMLEKESRAGGIPYDYHVFCIQMDREILYQRINTRVDNMIQQGLIQEVKNLLQEYQEFPTAMQGLGYKEVVEYLQGRTTKEEMIETIKRETRRYAKRQLTWFRKNKQTIWLDGLRPKQENIAIILEEYSEKKAKEDVARG